MCLNHSSPGGGAQPLSGASGAARTARAIVGGFPARPFFAWRGNGLRLNRGHFLVVDPPDLLVLKYLAHLFALVHVPLHFHDVVRVGDDLERAADAAFAAGLPFVPLALVLVDD